jgi:hypothetical protein
VIELGIERHDFTADRFQDARRKGPGGAVAAGGDDLQLALDLRPRGEIGDVAVGEVLGELVGATADEIKVARM